MSSSNDKGMMSDSGSKSEEDVAKDMSRPPVIPFDFAREDLPDKKVKEIISMLEKEKVKVREELVPSPSRNPYIVDDRPTGYEIDTSDVDSEPDWVPSASMDDSLKFLKNVYIVSESFLMYRMVLVYYMIFSLFPSLTTGI